jgi:hypothetical protein
MSGAWVVAGARQVAPRSAPPRPLSRVASLGPTAAPRAARLGGVSDALEPSASPRRIGGQQSEGAMTIACAGSPIADRIDSNLIRGRRSTGGPYPNLRFWSRLVRFQVSI